jgi:integrase
VTSERLPYVVARENANGTVRYYWQRKGHPMRRLSDDPVIRLGEAIDLNRGADKSDATPRGSIAWCIATYRKSAAYRKLRPESLRVYDRWLAHFGKKLGRFQARDLPRPQVMEIRDTLAQRYGESSVLHAFAVLRLIFKAAVDYGYITVNPAKEPELSRPGPRQALWTDEQIAAVLKAAPPEVGLAIRLLLYTAQRPSDVIRMAWSQYDGESITVRQVKTGALIAVPAHRDLRLELDATRRRGPLICVRPSGRAWRVKSLRTEIGKALSAAKVSGLQVRDLRRSAVVRLAEAGCEVPEIVAITGHALKSAETILQVYLPRTLKTATRAMRKWEQSAQ